MVPNTSFLPNVIVVSSLPNPDSFVKDAYDMAWPQILSFSSAVLGILAVTLIIKAFTKGG